jgi:hypothetical protein
VAPGRAGPSAQGPGRGADPMASPATTGTGRVRPVRSVRPPRPAALSAVPPEAQGPTRRRAGRCRHPDRRWIRSARGCPERPATAPVPARPPRAGRGGPRGGRSTRWSRERHRSTGRTRAPIRRTVPPHPCCPRRRAGRSLTRWCGTRRGHAAAGPRRLRWPRLGWGAPDGRWAGRSPGGDRHRWSRGRRAGQASTRWPTGRPRLPATARPGTPASRPRRTRSGTGPAPDQVACLGHPRAPLAAGRVPWPSRSSAPSGRHAFACGGGPRCCSVAAPGDGAGSRPGGFARHARAAGGGYVPLSLSTRLILSRIQPR